MDKAPIRVLCVDDNRRLTAAWEKLLGMQPDMQFAGVLHSADDLVKTASATRATIVLLDLTMEGREPLDALADLSRTLPDCRAIVYSGFTDTDAAERAFKAGAWGCVGKHDDPQNILEAIRRVARGETVMPEDWASNG